MENEWVAEGAFAGTRVGRLLGAARRGFPGWGLGNGEYRALGTERAVGKMYDWDYTLMWIAEHALRSDITPDCRNRARPDRTDVPGASLGTRCRGLSLFGRK